MKIKEIVKMEKELNEFKYNFIKIIMELVTDDIHQAKEILNSLSIGFFIMQVKDYNENIEQYKLDIIKDIAKKYYDMKSKVDKWLEKEVE